MTDTPDDLRAWAKEVSIRHCHNVAAVALANKRLAPHARLTIVARALSPPEGPEIRLQSTLRRRG